MLKHFRTVNIEIHSQCNRTCSWCPNSILDRHTEDHTMPIELFTKIMNELKDEEFDKSYHPILYPDKTIAFLGYQEPFLRPDLLKQYSLIARNIFPTDVWLSTNTNGDYLTKESLNGLHLNILNVMDYDNRGEAYWRAKMKDLECVYIYPATSQTKLSFMSETVNLIQIHLNWPQSANIQNRGGIFNNSNIERHKDCPEMHYYITIEHNGLVMPCCNMRSDYGGHADYILGDLNTQTLREIMTSERYIELQNILKAQDSTGFPGICTYCTKTRPSNLKGSPDGYDCYVNGVR